MAGRGPAPKDPSRRAGKAKDPHPTTLLRHEVVRPPALPSGLARMRGVRRWWETWKHSPQAEHFGATDWLFLLETSYLVAAFYAGDMSVAGELRLRQAKFGATPEDRARLRMQFAQADDADAKRIIVPTSSRERRGELHALPSPKVAGG